tara:strand:+ start:12629 stop:12964 length:336 start_codon:yes stop_codon:yes gene_type:complete
MDKVINNAELLFYLEQMGVGDLINIYDNRDEVKEICNKIGRPDLFKSCIKEIEETEILSIEKLKEELLDPDYSTESETYSETDEDELVEEQYIINPTMNGFMELTDVKLPN